MSENREERRAEERRTEDPRPYSGVNTARKFRHRTRRRVNGWLIAGVIVLIVLLLFWLTWADFLGDTDVAASVPLLF